MKKSYILYTGIEGQGKEDIATFDNKQDVINTGMKMMKYACRKILKKHPNYYIKFEFDKADNNYDFNLYNQDGKYLDDNYQCFLSFEVVAQNPTNNKDIKDIANRHLVVLDKPWY